MSKRFASLFATFALAIGLLAPNAFAYRPQVVTATQATGHRGDVVSVTMTVDGIPTALEPTDFSSISAYTFNFLWDASVLNWNGYSSTVDLTPATFTLGSGAAVFDWIDSSFSAPVNFGTQFSITASFQILNDAPFGMSTIVFGDIPGPGVSSVLMDSSFNTFSFSNVNRGSQMQVDVQQSVTPVPEPAEVSMLLAGLGLMAAVIRRRKNRQA